jgi:hypothetical protein
MTAHLRTASAHAGVGLAVLAALLVTACSVGASDDGSAELANQSAAGPPGLPGDRNPGDPGTPPNRPAAPGSDNPRPPGNGASPSESGTSTGWERDSRGRAIGPAGW